MSTSTSKNKQPAEGVSAANHYRMPAKYAWALLAASVVAFIGSAILVLERLELYKNPQYTASCDVGGPFSCSSVMETPQAALFGFPNQLLGIVGFAVTITIGVVLLTEALLPRWFFLGLLAGTAAAMLLVCWFWFQAVYVINMLCIYCMVVWAMVIPMFWIVLRFVITHGIIPCGAKLRNIFADWTWLAIVLCYLTVVFSIIFAFIDVWASMK